MNEKPWMMDIYELSPLSLPLLAASYLLMSTA